jgi:hypothetical protein
MKRNPVVFIAAYARNSAYPAHHASSALRDTGAKPSAGENHARITTG